MTSRFPAKQGFRQIKLENWKNFTQVDVPLQQRMFLVGPNASGKSNFLDVFRFLRDIAFPGGGGLLAAVSKRGGVTKIRSLAARQKPDVKITVEVDLGASPGRWTYEIGFSGGSLPEITLERIRKNGKDMIAPRPSPEDRADPERLQQSYLELKNLNKDFRELVNVLQSVDYIHTVPQLIREPERYVAKARDPFGSDVLEQIGLVSEKERKRRLDLICKALSVAVPQLTELRWKRIGRVPHLEGRYSHWRPQGAWQSEDQFSDGTLRLFGLLWTLLDSKGPLLLEEPELSLHPEVVREIPQLIARIQSKAGRQVFISTHSGDLLRDGGIGIDEVLLLRPEKDGTSVKPTSCFREIVLLLQAGLDLTDAVMPYTKPENVEQLALFSDGLR